MVLAVVLKGVCAALDVDGPCGYSARVLPTYPRTQGATVALVPWWEKTRESLTPYHIAFRYTDWINSTGAGWTFVGVPSSSLSCFDVAVVMPPELN